MDPEFLPKIRADLDATLRYADANRIDLGPPTAADLEAGPAASREQALFDYEGVPGRQRLAERPAGSILCRSVRLGCHVIFPRLAGSFRNAADCLRTIRIWMAIGVVAHLLDLGADTSTDEGKAIVECIGKVADWATADRSDRARAAHARARFSGQPMRRNPDPGFRWEWTSDGRRYMAPCPAELALIRTLNRWREEGVSEREMYARLLRAGVRTPDWGWGPQEYSRRRVPALLAAVDHVAGLERHTGEPFVDPDVTWLDELFDAYEERQTRAWPGRRVRLTRADDPERRERS